MHTYNSFDFSRLPLSAWLTHKFNSVLHSTDSNSEYLDVFTLHRVIAVCSNAIQGVLLTNTMTGSNAACSVTMDIMLLLNSRGYA